MLPVDDLTDAVLGDLVSGLTLGRSSRNSNTSYNDEMYKDCSKLS